MDEPYDVYDVRNWAKEEISKTGEDYVYLTGERGGDEAPVCRYYEEDGSPSCLIGRMLDSNGVISYDWTGRDHSNFVDARELVQNHLKVGTFTYDAMLFMRKLQYFQDTGVAWGKALQQTCLYMNNNYGTNL